MFVSRVALFTLHESPKFLVASDRPRLAVRSLDRISRFNGRPRTERWTLTDVVDHLHHDEDEDEDEFDFDDDEAGFSNGSGQGRTDRLPSDRTPVREETERDRVFLRDRVVAEAGQEEEAENRPRRANGGDRDDEADSPPPPSPLRLPSRRDPTYDLDQVDDDDDDEPSRSVHAPLISSDRSTSTSMLDESDLESSTASSFSFPSSSDPFSSTPPPPTSTIPLPRRSSSRRDPVRHRDPYAPPPRRHPRRARRRRQAEWIDRLPIAWRPAATEYLARVETLTNARWKKVTGLVWAIWTLASAGYTIFNVFLPKFLEQKLGQSAGRTTSSNPDESLRDYVLYTLSGLPGSLLGAYLVETSFGRARTLCYSTVATAVATCVFVFVQGPTGIVASSMVVSLAATLMYAVIYSLTPEIFPTALRGTASGIASALSRLSGIVCPLVTGYLLAVDVRLPLLLSSLCFFLTAVSAAFLVPVEEDVLGRGTPR
ncbi:hypothetical protein JCM10212_005919 [Sporobolomyces blumeae]